MEDLQQTELFLRTCYQNHSLPPDSVIGFFNGRTRLTRRFKPDETGMGDAVRMIAAVAGAAEQSDLYVNCCPQRLLSPHSRGGKADAVAATMLWADIDLGGKPDAKKSYPPYDVAINAVMSMPLRPTFIVRSSQFGLYAFWVFKEPVVFSEQFTVEQFEAHSKAWQQILRLKLEAAGGYALDSTHDAARMLRIVGSKHKSGSDVVIQLNGERSIFPFDAFVGFTEAVAGPVQKVGGRDHTDGEAIQFEGLTFDPMTATKPQ